MITETSICQLANALHDSATFSMSLGSKELFHSNFLQWLYQIDRDMFARILHRLGIDIELNMNSEMRREYNHYDLCITHKVHKRGNKYDDCIDLIIENKVKSIPTKRQLDEYWVKTQGSKHMLLTLVADFLQKEEISKQWAIATYADLADAIAYAKSDTTGTGMLHSMIIDDYVSFIRNLNAIAQLYSLSNTTCFYHPYKDILRSIRIDDLIEKLRTSQMAIELGRLVGEVSGREAKAMSRDKMFKSASPGEVIVNSGLTHAEGLVELKVLVCNNVALLIQIQGGKYCYGIELSGTKRNDAENWAIYSEDANYAWFLCSEEAVLPEKNGYNKYGNEFLYRYWKIPPEASAKDVINRVISDYIRIIEHFGI